MMTNQMIARSNDPKAMLPKLYLKSHPTPLLQKLKWSFLQKVGLSACVRCGREVPEADSNYDDELSARNNHGQDPKKREEQVDEEVPQSVITINLNEFAYQTSCLYWVPPVTATISPEEER